MPRAPALITVRVTSSSSPNLTTAVISFTALAPPYFWRPVPAREQYGDADGDFVGSSGSRGPEPKSWRPSSYPSAVWIVLHGLHGAVPQESRGR
jgi:hypothetical protein